MRDLFRLLVYLQRLARDVPRSRSRIVAVVLLGLASGPASAGVVALINHILSGSSPAGPGMLLGFAALCLALPACRYASQMMLYDLAQSTLLALRLKLSARVLRAPLRQIEQIGANRLLTVLANDIGAIIDSLALVPVVLMNASLLLSFLVYLAWLDWELLLKMSLYIGVLMVVSYFAVRKALLHFRHGRYRMNDLIGQIRSMIEGTKELKMHRQRREAFLGSVESTTRALLAEQRAGQVVYTASSSAGQSLFYLLVGVLVLVLPRIEPVPAPTLISYTVILFSLLSPMEGFLATLPALSRAAVSVAAVEDLGLSLAEETPEDGPALPTVHPAWDRLELLGVTHTYQRGSDEKFLLGPIDLTIRPGELVFLVGGNGSGKTTLAKLILGLYAPESGEIRFAGRTVSEAGLEKYRESFSAVFVDFFLFESLLGLDGTNLDDEARHYLQSLHLDHKVRVEGGTLSTLNLSQGERKRLALLTAYLEDRPVYLFDEWAADQDPLFKQIFYLEILPELKRRGKAVLVISHDDHFFHVADRIVKLDCGQIEYDLPQGEIRPAGGDLSLQALGSLS